MPDDEKDIASAEIEYEEAPEGTVTVEDPSPLPTRKWVAALIVALGALGTMWASTGSWDVEETVALIGLVVERSIAYLTPNSPEPGGVVHRYQEVEVGDAPASKEEES